MTPNLIHRLENPTYIVPNAHLDAPSTIQTMREAAELIRKLLLDHRGDKP
jgi:hypothetical protein